jgi:hypothetical protein
LGEILRSQAVTREAAKLRVIEGGPARDAFREEIVRGLVACLPRALRNAARFHGHHIDDLVHWLKQYEREPWTDEAVDKAYDNPLFTAYELTEYFGTRRPRHGWSIMARMIGSLTLTALRGAYELAGHKPRGGYGRAGSRTLAFVYDRLASIVGDAMPSHENLLKTLQRGTPKTPQKPRRCRRKPQKSR